MKSWFEGAILQEKEEQVSGFSFQQLILEVSLNINDPKNVLKHVSPMNDIGYPFFKNMSFKNANSLSKLVQLEQTNWKTSESQTINHAKFICSR